MAQEEQHWYYWEALSGGTPQMKKVASLPKHFEGRKPEYSACRSECRDGRSLAEWRDSHAHRVIGQGHYQYAYLRYSSDGTEEGTVVEVWGWEPQWGAPPDAVGPASPGAAKKKPPPKKKGKGNK